MLIADYPAEVVGKIADVLGWIQANPDGQWDAMGELLDVYTCYKHIFLGFPPLLDNNGTMFSVRRLTAVGHSFLIEARRKGKKTALDRKHEKPTKGKGGSPRLETRDPLMFQVYERIHREHLPKESYADVVERLMNDKDFVEQVRLADLTLNRKLVKNAIAAIEQRKRDQARKKQETLPG
jgi:hypothetical protein